VSFSKRPRFQPELKLLRDTDRITIRFLTRNRKIPNALLLEAKRSYMKDIEALVCVYVYDQTNDWKHVASRPKRPMRSIILERGVKELILEDAKDFLGSKQWYADRGIPHRRGYLLYGKPGSGKTSLIQVRGLPRCERYESDTELV
jgi:chaperone BCS1